MDRPEHVESDVARIESKIRRLRFTKDSLERWMKWGALLGLILGTGAAVCFFLDSFAGPLKLLDDWGKITPEITTLAWAVLLVVGSVFLGFLLPALVFGLIICFRPVYVALFCDIAQFEREYGSTPEPLGRLPRRIGS